MKANEAPEKIYVDSKAIGDDISTTVHTKRQDYSTCTEYTRTDAFIEKACEWLDNNIWAYIEIMHPTVDSYTRINSERLICDFKKVMRR